jgi:hypothetical protein
LAQEYRIAITFDGKDTVGNAAKGAAAGIRDVGEAADKADKSTGGFFANMMSSAAGFLAANVIGGIANQFADFMGSAISDAREANIIMGQTQATIKSTGGAAGLTAEQIADMAGQMSAAAGKSLFGDDLIQQGQNVLLTFTNIGEEVFPLATQTSLDMAQALHKTPEAMSMLIGKALNSADAMGALRKNGVAFTDEQIALGKHLFETGDIIGYQKLVLSELNTEFGGSAEAAAKADGGVTQFKDRLGEMGEGLAAKLLPALDIFVGFLNDKVLPVVEDNLSGALDWLSNTGIPALITAWESVQPALEVTIEAVDDLGTTLAAVLTDAQPVVDFVGANLEPIMLGLATALTVVVIPAFVAWAISAGTAAVATLAALAPVVLPIVAIGAAVALLKAAWDSDFGGIRTTLTSFWESTGKPIFDQLAGWLGEKIPSAVSTMSNFFSGTLWPALQKVWTFLDANVLPILNALAMVGIAVVKKEVELLSAVWNNVLWPALEKVWGFIDGSVIPIFADVATGMSAAGAVVNETLGPALNWLGETVLDRVNQSLGYISKSVSEVIGFFKRLADSISAIEIPEWLQGHSPPPLADWFDYIGEAVVRVSDEALPDFLSAINSLGVAMTQSVAEDGEAAIAAMEKTVAGLVATAGKLPDLLADATAGMFDTGSDVARLMERNLAKLDSYSAAQQEAIQKQLGAAEAAAAAMDDPAEAAKFLALRSKHIFEIADLEKALATAGDSEREKIEKEHAKRLQDLDKETFAITDALNKAETDEERAALQEKLRLNEQARQAEYASHTAALNRSYELAEAERRRIAERIALIKKAQDAEQKALETRQKNEESMFEKLATTVQDLFSKIDFTLISPEDLVAIEQFRALFANFAQLAGLPTNVLPQPEPIGQNAMGTSFWSGGLTWVGERGRELVNLPRGSQVLSNRDSERMAAGGNHYHLHLTTSAPTVSILQEFAMLQASAGVS